MHAERAQEDLAMIRRLLEEGRREVVDRGKHFIIWGVIPAVGAALTYAYVAGAGVPHPGWIWGGAMLVGWGLSLVVGWRDSRGARVHTFGRRLLSVVWVAAAVSLTLIGAAGIAGVVLGHESLPGVLSAVMGAPVLVTMLLTGERWLGLVAAGWWIGGAVMLFVPGRYALLLLAVMGLLLMAVPGAVLNARARRRGSGREEDVVIEAS